MRISPVSFSSKQLKSISLATLVVQNSALVVVMRYSRIYANADGSMYLSSTAVLLSEVFKFIVSLYMFMRFMAQEGTLDMHSV